MSHYKVSSPDTVNVAIVSVPSVVNVFVPGETDKEPGLFAVGNLKITIPEPPDVPPGADGA